MPSALSVVRFFSKATLAPEIYTLSLHDALPISPAPAEPRRRAQSRGPAAQAAAGAADLERVAAWARSEEHTSELQSRGHLVCRLLLEKKKKDGSASHPCNSKSGRRRCPLCLTLR